jgi:hypothetical protein
MSDIDSPIRQIPYECLRTWGTHRVGCGFMNSFSASRDYPGELGQLEVIVTVLRDRPFDERLAVFKEIDVHLKSNVEQEDYERAAVLRDMKEYYKVRVLD